MPYTASLDGIRAIAALVIVAYHARIPGLPGGFFGVDVFFVLSGYLVTRLLAEEYAQSGTIRYRAFMQRRIRRLSPALLTMLAAYLLAAPWLFAEVPFARHVRDAWWSALYLLNYASVFGEPVAILGNVWSLAVEMQFYLLWPLVLLIVLKMPRPAALAALAALYLLATAWRAASPEHLGDVWAFYIRTDTHCSGLLLGSFIGLLNPPAPARRTAACMAMAGIVILAFALTFYSTKWIVTVQYGFTVAEAAAALLVVACPSWLGGAVFAWLGRMSYGLYLWHYPIMRALREQGWENHDWPAILAVGGTLGLLCAAASHHWVEGRFYRRRAG
ncbi:acyltransferase family protein [Thauera linaloolentis]|uniref:Acyltransferase 3 n=1 Tax=Thauera linaloolentis (strain DSM 12138 / JCM 21573 / CCUG 41526 / CIP 105981 / IAM 15112 / NBRC 102519 / 47Lol) TaxID=1123367 RepID=N6YSU9_THAL4|nr:acyltransferase [Thauera linaloolentis]ENO85427.1 acyltransferase 3 [Thauera linaloolentis 47Lol = DSM 12138]MCM8567642.1 acyltransferase [Thauera linaloolentis]